jgi:hypothetical protein
MKYKNTTVDFFDSSHQQTGSHTFSGSFVWIHFNVFVVHSFIKGLLTRVLGGLGCPVSDNSV